MGTRGPDHAVSYSVSTAPSPNGTRRLRHRGRGRGWFLYSERRNVRPLPPYKEGKQGQFAHLPVAIPSSRISATPLLPKAEGQQRPPPLPPAPPTPSPSLSIPAMAPKAKKAKSAEVQRLAALRKERAIFPPRLEAAELKEDFYLFWSTGTRAHPRTKVLQATAWDKYPTGYPFFALFFYCGPFPPFSEFFCDIMNTYGLHLLDFTPNAVLTMAVFAHLCENFVGIHPNVALFRHFFSPRVEKGEPLSGGIAWIS